MRGFDLAMMEVGYRYTELHWAGQDKNWDYAKYQCEKIQHVIELAMERRTNRAPSAQWFLTNAIPPMKAAIEARMRRHSRGSCPSSLPRATPATRWRRCRSSRCNHRSAGSRR
jgi:hypothetical protein